MALVSSRNNGSTNEEIVTGKSAPLNIFQRMFLHRKRIAVMIGTASVLNYYKLKPTKKRKIWN